MTTQAIIVKGDRVSVADRARCIGTVSAVFDRAILITLDDVPMTYCVEPERVRLVEQ